MLKTNKLTIKMSAIILVLLLLVCTIFVDRSVKANAATTTDVVSSFEAQDVLADLENSVIAGEKFDLANFPFDEKQKPQIISFVEFGYNARATKQDDYGLYVYLYNPQGLDIDTSVSKSTIQIAFGNTESYVNYQLDFLNRGSRRGYEGLFYKFKVVLTSRQKDNALSQLSQNERIYNVSGIDISVKRQLTAYTVAQVYTYSGYAKGYGPDVMTDSTLSCAVDGMEKYLELDVHHTVYRPKGDYFEGQQSQLNSCYFRVPEKYYSEDGDYDLTKIAGEWYEYVTKPILVTESSFLYQRLYNLHGASVSNFSNSADFLIVALGNTDTSWWGADAKSLGYLTNIDHFDDGDYHVWYKGQYLTCSMGDYDPDLEYDNLAAVFYAGSFTSYEDRSVSAEELIEQLLDNTDILGGPYLVGRYSEQLFTDYVNRDHVRGKNIFVISKDTYQDIYWNETVKSNWQHVFGGYTVNTEFDTVQAIYTVTEADLKGSDGEIAARLYIAEKDVAGLKAEFKKCKDERLVLFRFAVSDYYSMPCIGEYAPAGEDSDDVIIEKYLKDWYDKEYNGYIAQETVYLNFKIIALTFKSDDAEVVIPVISSPSDVISGIDPPLEENYDDDGIDWLMVIAALLGFILVVLVVIIFWPIFRPVFVAIGKALLWVLMLPINGIKALANILRRSSSKPKTKKKRKK